MVENVAADSVLTGFEAHADVKLTNELTAEVTYDWVQGELKDSGDPLPRIPPYRVLAGLTYQKNAFQVGGSAQIVVGSEPRVRRGAADRRVYARRSSSPSYSFTRGGVLNTITARLDNATDKLYRNHLNYLKDVLPEIGRSFKVVYSVGF